MKASSLLPLALALPLLADPAFAQGSGHDVTLFRMSGPQLGVRLEEVDKDVVSRLSLKEEKGALVTEVLEKSAAEKAGLKKDDVIVRFHGESVLTAAQLSRLVRDVPEGRKVDIEVVRAGSPLKLAATLERAEWSGDKMEMPEIAGLSERLGRLGELRFKSGDLLGKDKDGKARTFNFNFDEGGPGFMSLGRGGRARLGITYTEIEGQLARYFKAPKDTAVLVNSVVDGSAAEKAGIKAGDLVVKLGAAPVLDGEDLAKAVREAASGKVTPVTVVREGRNVDLSVTLEAPKSDRAEIRRRRPVS